MRVEIKSRNNFFADGSLKSPRDEDLFAFFGLAGNVSNEFDRDLLGINSVELDEFAVADDDDMSGNNWPLTNC